jgi:hypothetical protein
MLPIWEEMKLKQVSAQTNSDVAGKLISLISFRKAALTLLLFIPFNCYYKV